MAIINPVIPQVRSKLDPDGMIYVYRITSDDIKAFLAGKIDVMCPGAKVELHPQYCEKKRRKDDPVRASYAVLKVAFSEDVVEKGEQAHAWIAKMVESESNVRFVEKVWINMIRKYSYNRKELESYLEDYEILGRLEENLGMTEDFLKDMIKYSIPRRLPTTAEENWVFFNANPQEIIRDMLTDRGTKRLPGRMEMKEISRISKDTVEFLVYLHANEVESSENPEVRQLLSALINK